MSQFALSIRQILDNINDDNTGDAIEFLRENVDKLNDGQKKALKKLLNATYTMDNVKQLLETFMRGRSIKHSLKEEDHKQLVEQSR